MIFRMDLYDFKTLFTISTFLPPMVSSWSLPFGIFYNILNLITAIYKLNILIA
jgi:hypothetical protein